MVTMNLNKDNIETTIAKRIHPLIAIDGGKIEVVEVDENSRVVKLRLLGAYYGSPCRDTIIKYVVGPALREEIEEIDSIELVD